MRRDPLRVLLVDDDQAFVEAMAASLRDLPDVDVVGFAFDGLQAITRAARIKPDLIFMDLDMPLMDGLQATQIILAENAGCRVVAVSGQPQRESEAQAAGAHAFLHKGAELPAAVADVVAAMTQAAAGQVGGGS